jgi:hypothetical protein
MNDHKINQHFRPKYNQIVIFDMKIYHPATLLRILNRLVSLSQQSHVLQMKTSRSEKPVDPICK